MVYGFCYTRRRKDGIIYKVCPGYSSSEIKGFGKHTKTVIAKMKKSPGYSSSEMKGFGKHTKTVIAKMKKSGRPSTDYSKQTGLLKKSRKQ